MSQNSSKPEYNDDSSDPIEEDNFAPTGFNSEVPESHYRKKPTKAFLSFLIAVIVVGGLALAVSILGSKDTEPTVDSKRIAETWQKNKDQESSGVFFTMKLDSVSESNAISLIFDQKGKVSAQDSCFESESNYLVKEDGSIAVEGFKNDKLEVLDDAACVDVSPSELFFSSSLSYSNDSQSWLAYDADGKTLGDSLVEDTGFLASQKSEK